MEVSASVLMLFLSFFLFLLLRGREEGREIGCCVALRSSNSDLDKSLRKRMNDYMIMIL